VKDLFNNHGFRDRLHLSGVNSINWARVAVQAVYYFVAGVALGAPHRKVSFAVPTGNFGDIFAGFVAKQMGLPIERLVIATNDNDILSRAHETGVYETRGVVVTSSPSMDIQVSSNFERFLFEASGRDAGAVRRMMGTLKQSGSFELGPTTSAYRQDFAAAPATMTEVAAEILKTRSETNGYLLDPHTACAVVALRKRPAAGTAPEVVLATAHPAKFPDAMKAITGEEPKLPSRLKNLLTDTERITQWPNDIRSVETYIETHARAATAAAPMRGRSA
jgi:threonine synthase